MHIKNIATIANTNPERLKLLKIGTDKNAPSI
jgi:hypothetical protein